MLVVLLGVVSSRGFYRPAGDELGRARDDGGSLADRRLRARAALYGARRGARFPRLRGQKQERRAHLPGRASHVPPGKPAGIDWKWGCVVIGRGGDRLTTFDTGILEMPSAVLSYSIF